MNTEDRLMAIYIFEKRFDKKESNCLVAIQIVKYSREVLVDLDSDSEEYLIVENLRTDIIQRHKAVCLNPFCEIQSN